MKNKRWTYKDIQNTGLKHSGQSVSENTQNVPEKAKSVSKIPKSDPEGLSYIKSTLRLLKVDFETEYRFHPTRKFRFDVAIVEVRLAFEYEGIMSAKSRHTGIEGYTMDTVKYNLAQMEGWRVLRYTTINYLSFGHDIMKLLKL